MYAYRTEVPTSGHPSHPPHPPHGGPKKITGAQVFDLYPAWSTCSRGTKDRLHDEGAFRRRSLRGLSAEFQCTNSMTFLSFYTLASIGDTGTGVAPAHSAAGGTMSLQPVPPTLSSP